MKNQIASKTLTGNILKQSKHPKEFLMEHKTKDIKTK